MKLRRKPKDIKKGFKNGGFGRWQTTIIGKTTKSLSFVPQASILLRTTTSKDLRRMADWMNRSATYIEQQKL